VRMHQRTLGRIERATTEHTAQLSAWTHKEANQAAKLIRAHIEKTRDELAILFGS
jgi:DNA-binding GntR family transcriptional regulator